MPSKSVSPKPSADEALETLHAPTVRALLDLLTVDSTDGGFYYNEANDYGRIRLEWWTGKGDPLKRFAGEALTAQYRTQDGGVEVRKTGRYRLNDKAVAALMRELKTRQRQRRRAAEKAARK